MAQDILLRKLDEAADRAKVLVREKDQATARMQSLESETKELRHLIYLAESKADEMLKGGHASLASRESEELKRRFPRAFTSDFY